MNKAQKQKYIENLDQMSKDYSAMFIASFYNMSVKEMIQFRTEIRNNEGVTKISKNNIVKIGRFGSFYSFYTKERTGRNPRTKEEYIIPEVLKIKFKPFNLVKKNIN